jgi:hypothetical protein
MYLNTVTEFINEINTHAFITDFNEPLLIEIFDRYHGIILNSTFNLTEVNTLNTISEAIVRCHRLHTELQKIDTSLFSLTTINKVMRIWVKSILSIVLNDLENFNTGLIEKLGVLVGV